MAISFDDLFLTCAKCGGSGEVRQARTDGVAPAFGQPRVLSTAPCDQCDGRGGALTPAGEALLRFLDVAEAKRLRP